MLYTFAKPNGFLVNTICFDAGLYSTKSIILDRSLFVAIKDLILSNTSPVTPTAAATLNLPYLSLQALGRILFLIMSLKVIKPTRQLSLSTIGNFSILLLLRMFSAFSKSFIKVVTRLFEVITSLILKL